MEFKSLSKFKDAIRELSVLNGREITFVMNESYRVRVKCKGKCGFLALCSKVGDRHTYQIKTWVRTHTCARVLNKKLPMPSGYLSLLWKRESHMEKLEFLKLCLN